jgi:hypothetical protein
MKGCISQRGTLLIKRGKIFIDQFCHFVPVPDWECSDKCPHFSEPENIYDPKTGQNDGVTLVTRLQLCHGKILYFDEFTDERAKE